MNEKLDTSSAIALRELMSAGAQMKLSYLKVIHELLEFKVLFEKEIGTAPFSIDIIQKELRKAVLSVIQVEREWEKRGLSENNFK